MGIATTLPRLALHIAGVCLCILLLFGCSAKLEQARLYQLRSTFAAANYVDDVPFFPQQIHQCGPAALAMLLTWSGLERQPDELTEQVYIPRKNGSIQAEMLASARRHGRITYPLKGGLHDLAAELEAGHPVLVLQNLGLDWLPRWHYAVVTGLNLEQQSVRLHSGITQNYELNLATFLHTWDRAENWGAVILRPGILPASAKPRPYLRAVLDTQNSATQSSALELDKLNFVADIESAYLKAIEKWPTQAILRMGLANWYQQENFSDKALLTLNTLLQQQPAYAPAHNNLALLLFQQDKLTLALEHAKTAVALGGAHRSAYLDTLDQIRLGLQ